VNTFLNQYFVEKHPELKAGDKFPELNPEK
jgi:hypothetical protein